MSKTIKKLHNQKGFTLIEVMVALAILAVVAVTATRASMGYLQTFDGMKTRTLAHFVAQNAAVQLTLNKAWLTATKTEKIQQQGNTWQVSYTPKPFTNSHINTTNVQMVTINVQLVTNDEQSNGNPKLGLGSSIDVALTNPQVLPDLMVGNKADTTTNTQTGGVQ